MDIFIDCMIFIMGTFFGSFFTLAVYRIPLKLDITHEHSFCPNCNHKLGVLDLVPIWSYVFLRGKCRYCGQKVRIRYLILEVLSGVVFLLSFLSFKIEIIPFDFQKFINFTNFVFLYVTLVLIAGIDKEYRTINLSVLTFGGVCQTLYILYLYIVGDANMYRYSIYLAIFIVSYLLSLLQRKNSSYIRDFLLLELYVLAVLKPFLWRYYKCSWNHIGFFVVFNTKNKIKSDAIRIFNGYFCNWLSDSSKLFSLYKLEDVGDD